MLFLYAEDNKLYKEELLMNVQLAKMIDHTLLKPEATEEGVRKLCEEAKEYNFATVCINPSYVALAKKMLEGTEVGITTVIGFPLGANTSTVKAFETNEAIENGATDVDMVIHIGALKDRRYDYIKQDIEAVVKAANKRAIVKVIIETSLLSDDEKEKVCLIAKEAGADFVKTSTGFSTGGATREDIMLMRKTVGSEMGVKASGGVRNAQDAESVVQAGATRIGASASIAIVTGGTSTEKY